MYIEPCYHIWCIIFQQKGDQTTISTIRIIMVNESINSSKWTHYEVISPPGLAGLALSNAIIYTAIFITNSLILATFSKMKKKSLHQHLMICLAIIDLLTIQLLVICIKNSIQLFFHQE